MASRTVEDLLREEYFDLLPEIRRTVEHLETEVRYHLLPILSKLRQFERVVIRSRVKECESAVQSLRRRQEAGTFIQEASETYTLEKLRDLAAVRVLAFPRSRLIEIKDVLQLIFSSWIADPVVSETGETLAFKYWGDCPTSGRVRGEYQVVSMLTGLFWEIEHSAIYKPTPRLIGLSRSHALKEATAKVHGVLSGFEDEFERLAEENNEA